MELYDEARDDSEELLSYRSVADRPRACTKALQQQHFATRSRLKTWRQWQRRYSQAAADFFFFFEAVIANKAKVQAKRLSDKILSLQVNNKLLREENLGLQEALNAKKKHKTKRTTMVLQQREEFHGGAVFWSPRKLRETQRCRAVTTPENS
jgi:hypothetical protein